MMANNSYNLIFLYSFISIWVLLLYHILLAYFGYRYHDEISSIDLTEMANLADYPMVTVIIPAHNEEKVIYYSTRAVLDMDYPQDRFEVIVVNDNSNDRTGEILADFEKKYSHLKVITTSPENGGGRGKSAALNRAFRASCGEYLVVYDADNTPERKSLRFLVAAIQNNRHLGAVCGKFRVRNKDKNILTRFINLETLAFQWMAQAGRWRLFGLATIPGTNFIIRRDVLTQLGGWNEDAITEDTELSIRIYQMGYKIRFFPLAITWEQEPEKWSVWVKQRTRWVRGNIYVINKFIWQLFKGKNKRIAMDIIYYIAIYFLFLSSVLVSDFLFIGSLLGLVELSITGPYKVLWILAFVLYVVEMAIAVSQEEGESNFKNIFYIVLSYFTYSQAWIILTIRSIFISIRDTILGKKVTWYKTERF